MDLGHYCGNWFAWHLSEFFIKWDWSGLLWFYEYNEWQRWISVIWKLVSLEGGAISAGILIAVKWSL